jgi:RNA polymerase sigma-70 factor (ECF subfamily)
MDEAQPAGSIPRLLQAARGGSQEALGQLLQTYRNYLLLVANRALDPDLRAKGGASDLTQETFCKAQADFGNFAGQTPGELLAWLRRILLNNLANFTRHFRETDKRRLAREVPLEQFGSGGDNCALEASTPSPSQAAMRRERAEQLEQALRRLPDHYRQVIVLRHREGRAFEEIGQALHRTPEAARKLWLRAIA